ncbi:uncharacterized protein IWZ02DRAFT_172001 [Phyllosticta citriasiana]|uniref:Uncharacterized protein n=1 Tax=Phyllosticta citriasiana TaxID=595635 RepID=A0ABR1KHZ9_9PEZI
MKIASSPPARHLRIVGQLSRLTSCSIRGRPHPHSAPTALPLSLRERLRRLEATAARHWHDWELETTRGCTSETPLSILVVPESFQDGTFLPTGPHYEDSGISQINDQPRDRGSCFLIGLASHSRTCFESSLFNDLLPSRLRLHNSRLPDSASLCNASWETSCGVVCCHCAFPRPSASSDSPSGVKRQGLPVHQILSIQYTTHTSPAGAPGHFKHTRLRLCGTVLEVGARESATSSTSCLDHWRRA